MSHRHRNESPGWQSEALDKHTDNADHFATVGPDRKDLADDDLEGMGKCRMLKALQRRSARFGSGLYPLHGDNLLMSLPGGFSFVVPDLSAAHRLLRQMEGRA